MIGFFYAECVVAVAWLAVTIYNLVFMARSHEPAPDWSMGLMWGLCAAVNVLFILFIAT